MSAPPLFPSSSAPIPFSSSALSLLDLADVELQLIMHGLSALELVALARCHTRLFHAATTSTFGWKHSRLSFDVLRVPSASIAPGRLLCHASIDLRVDPWEAGKEVAEGPGVVLRALDLPLPLHELDMSHAARHTSAVCQQILAHPAMQNLRVLRMHHLHGFGVVDADIVRLLCALPHLHTLGISPDFRCQPSAFAMLRSVPQLTSLQITDTYSQLARSFLPHVSQCPKLAHLYVRSPALYGPSALRSFFLSPHLRHQLQSLTLDRFSASGLAGCAAPSPADYAESFAALQSLHTLQLLSVIDVDRILPHLAGARALRWLMIRASADQPSMAPSVGVLVQLWIAAPQLAHCTLKLQPFVFILTAAEKATAAKIRHQMSESQELEEQRLAGRFTLQSAYDSVLD
jgi:hypothetical protein